MPDEHEQQPVAAVVECAQRQDWDGALEALDELLEQHPADPVRLLQKALLLDRLGRSQAAEQTLATLLAAHPDHVAAQPLRRRLGENPVVRQQRHEAALALLREADELLRNGAAESAATRARAALALGPDLPAAHAVLGEALLQLGDSAAASHALALGRGLELVAAAEPAPDDEPTLVDLGSLRAAGWRLARDEPAAWLLLDAGAAVVVLLPVLLLAALPVTLLAATGGSEPGDRLLTAAPTAWIAGWIAALWLLVGGGWYVCGRTLLLARKAATGDFDGPLLFAGYRRFGRVWWQLALLAVLFLGLPVPLVLGGVTILLLLFLKPALSFAVPLVILGDRDAFRACSDSYEAVRDDWGAWLTLLLVTGLPCGLGFVAANGLPAAIVWRQGQAAAAGLPVAVAVAAVVWLWLSVGAWYLGHAGLLTWAVAYDRTFGTDGRRGVAAALGVDVPGEEDENDEVARLGGDA